MSESLSDVAAPRPAAAVSRQPALRFERYSTHVGATVFGIDLSAPVTSATAAALREGLHQYGVLFFRDQQLSAAQFLEATRAFGEPYRHNPYLPSIEQFSGVEIIESGVGRRTLANESWHADVTWQYNPPQATALHAAELPPRGGDTVWTSATAAFTSLPAQLQTYYETLTASNYVDAIGSSRAPGLVSAEDEDERRLAELRVKYPPIDVPVVATHPVTGQKSIFVNELHTSYIKGVERAVSESLLRISVCGAGKSSVPRALSLAAYGEQRRVLHRVTLA